MTEAKKVEIKKDELPEGWVASTLGDIASYIQRGKSPKYTEFSELPVVNQKCIRWHGIEREHVKYIHPDQFEQWDEKRYLKNGNLLWNSTGTGTIGRAAIVHLKEGEKLVADSHVTIVRSGEGIEPKYVHYWVMSPAVQNSIEAMQSGSTNQVELSKGAVESTPIPVAPPEQQKRIVAKIEELFSHIDAGIESLKKAKQLLKQYRQSVLKAAVTGELTKEWRDAQGRASVAGGRTPEATKLKPASQLLEHILKERRERWEEQQLEQFKAKGKMPKDDKWKGKYKEPESRTPIDDELPEGWLSIPLDYVADVISGFAFKSKDFIAAGVPAVKIANVSYGEFVWKQQEYLPEVYLEKYKSFVISPRDILLALTRPITNNTVKACLYPDEAESALLNQRVCTIKNGKYLLKDYLLQVLQSEPFKQQINDGMSETLLPNLSPNDLKKFKFGLSSIEEQKEIVRLVEEKLGIANRLLVELEHQHVKAEKNKQSILASAFSGRLYE